MTLTLMAVHAHPDDEATGTGGVLAKAAAEGIRTVLVTCTDGRFGDAPGGIKPGEPGHDPDAVAALRVGELEASCRVLGIDHLETLGYFDSGMDGWSQNSDPHAFWGTSVSEAGARLAALMEEHRPDVVVTYDPNGFYGHPDHIQAHRITMDAVERTGIPAKVYWTTIPRSVMEGFRAMAKELGEDLDEVKEGENPVSFEMGLPDDEITTWVDVKAFGPAKYAALEAHASQTESIMFLRMGVETFTEVMGTETFVRVSDTTGAATPEADLFDGLR